MIGEGAMEKQEKGIVYGLGRMFEKYREYIENRYNVIAYCDREKKFEWSILPDEIGQYEYEKIIVTSSHHFSEIVENLVTVWNVDKKNILSLKEIIGVPENEMNRDSWVKSKLMDLPEEGILLDAGAGEQKYKEYCRHLKYIAQDFGEYIPNEINDGLQMNSWNYSGISIKSDIIDIPLESSSVDVILCTEVFEHLKYPILAINEFSRLLKKGGKLLLTAPVCCLTHMAPYFYYNGFSEFWYKDILEEYGFEIVEMTKNGNYFDYLKQELFRVEEVAERYASRVLTVNEYDSILKTIDLLSECSRLGNKSNELLCFGIMVEAKKVK